MRLESWIRPAGVSPVQVIAGEPGSRPQSRGEIPGAERGVESLLEGASARAATAASSDPRSGSRAAQITVKAMSVSPGSGIGLGGSLRGKGSCTRARSDHATRETRLSSLVSKDRSYKPVVKVCPGSCGGLAGVSPVWVVAKQPGSWWPAAGETRLSKRHDKAALGGEQATSPHDEEPCSLDMVTMREPSLFSLGEGHVRQSWFRNRAGRVPAG